MAEPNETDSILADVRAAATELTDDPPIAETGGPEPIDKTPAETPEQKAERVRDESGRFAKAGDKPRETLTLKDKPAAEVAPKPGDPPVAEKAAAEQAERIAPPPEWKGQGKVQWDKLPKGIQAEMRDIYQAVAAERAEVGPIRELLESHKQLLINETGSVQTGLNALFALARMSVDNPVGLIQHIAQSRGIDLRAFGGGQQPGQGAAAAAAAAAPDISSLIAQAVQQAVAPVLGQIQQTESQQTNQTIESFRADPKHPYFEDVRVHMGHLIKAGAAKDLQDAYDQAIWASPAIRPQLLAAQAEDAKKNQAAEVDRARKAAAASLRGSPLPNPTGATNQNSSVHDDVRAAAAELAGA